MDSKVREPKFSARSELARYVEEANRLNGNRTAVAAFIDPDPYLSVNSLEVESIERIAEYYQDRFQNGIGDVAVCALKVSKYSDAGKKAGVSVFYDSDDSCWYFSDKNTRQTAAYMPRPLRSSRDLRSESHCGVEFVRVLGEHERTKFARRLGGVRYHLPRMRKKRDR